MRCLAIQSLSLGRELYRPGIFTNIHNLIKNNALSDSTDSSIIK